jgi:hypothetical protein
VIARRAPTVGREVSVAVDSPLPAAAGVTVVIGSSSMIIEIQPINSAGKTSISAV